MESKTEPQLLLDDWAEKSGASQKLSPAEITPSVRVRKKTGPKPNPNVRRNHQLYGTWKRMRSRCNNSRSPDFKYYGGRGISVCKRWEDFWLFVADMGPKPTPKHEIDRKNNNLGYSKENCRWATRREQTNNFSRNRKITLDGVTRTLSEWATQLAVPRERIQNRLNRGWTEKEALTTPLQPSGNRDLEAHRVGWAKRKENQVSKP